MNQRLAEAAVLAIQDPRFEDQPGYCQKFVRQVIQKVYGDKFDRYALASAKDSAQAWLGSPYAIRTSDLADTQIGDILYKQHTSGRFGHVGIRVAGNLVAENSSTFRGRLAGAKGFRTLEQYGAFDVVVRLPEEL